MPHATRTILCVDDDADDREIVCHTISEIDPSFKVEHAADGQEAIEYLSKAKQEATLPCLVILDINMPRKDGKQTLAEIKKDEDLSELPVVVFTTSNNANDEQFCARYGVEKNWLQSLPTCFRCNMKSNGSCNLVWMFEASSMCRITQSHQGYLRRYKAIKLQYIQ